MKIIKLIGVVVVSLIVLFGIFLVVSSLIDYRPDLVEPQYTSSSPEVLSADSEISLVIWNIGYAGLDASMDFFYDGGKNVRPSKAGVEENFTGILSALNDYIDYDFILLQEVDQRSKRSYRINEYASIEKAFPDHHSSFGMNYSVWFVPLPVSKPMGQVKSGLQSLSNNIPREVVRHSFPGNYDWPLRLFMLDRCFLTSHFPTSNGKELVVVNTHNSAYDDGTLRKEQMAYLGQFILDEYARGNYVIVGGDWNQSPPDFEPLFDSERFDREDLTFIESSYPDSSWQWVYDATIPTNRRVKIPYDPVTSPVTVIDQFLISPNVRLIDVNGHETGFQYSDHQPVTMRVTLD